MKPCPNCTARNRSEARFCRRCGLYLDTPVVSQLDDAPFCDLCGAPLSRSQEHVCTAAQLPILDRAFDEHSTLESERKQVTILFADISASTKLISGLGPEKAWAFLDPILRVMMDAVTSCGGTVNQIRGDGIMALIGAPLAQEGHAARGCYAAVRMHELVAKMFESDQRDTPVRLHIGLATGEVLVGTIGTGLNRSYNAAGEVIHVAARLESIAEPGQTLCTSETVKQAGEHIVSRTLGHIELRGIAGAIETAEVLGLAPEQLRFHANAARGLTPFLAREREIEQLWKCWGNASGGTGQLVEIIGDAGLANLG